MANLKSQESQVRALSSHDKQLVDGAIHSMTSLLADLDQLAEGKERGKAGVLGRNLQKRITEIGQALRQLRDQPKIQTVLKVLFEECLAVFPGLSEAVKSDKVVQWAKQEMQHPELTRQTDPNLSHAPDAPLKKLKELQKRLSEFTHYAPE